MVREKVLARPSRTKELTIDSIRSRRPGRSKLCSTWSQRNRLARGRRRSE